MTAEATGESDIERAIARHRDGDEAGARSMYERILAERPDDATALHFAGVLAFGRHERELGIGLIGRALDVDPDYVDARNNLGNMLKLENRLEEAETHYRRALELAPEAIDPMINLGVLARARGDFDEAERRYRRVIALAPDNPLVYLNLAGLLDRQGRAAEALDAVQTAIARSVGDGPGHEPLHYRRALILLRLGRDEEARAAFARMLETRPDAPIPRHMLAALSDGESPPMPADGYVRELFDRFAQSFDEVLDTLDYRAPALVGERVARLHADADGTLRVLDAGCGTGLCGRHLRGVAATLEGIDLSGGMLARARVTAQYDTLAEAEIVAFLDEVTEPYDLIVSADTFCYFGALEALFAALHGALVPGAHTVFTVERADDAPERGYVLHPHGRYAHAADYVLAALERFGLAPRAIDEVVLRQERGEPVAGLLVTAARA